MTKERINYVDHEVVDDQHQTVGKITDVLYDDNENEPKWLVVKPGKLAKERYVPIEGSYESEDGNIVVPFDKKWVKSAPKADGDHVLTPEDRSEAEAHYDVEPS